MVCIVPYPEAKINWEKVHQDQEWGLLPNGWFCDFYEQYYKDSANLNFLDLGCANGPQTLYLAERGHRITALDIAQTALDRLKERLTDEQQTRVETVCCDVINYRGEPGKFDCVVEVSLFECIPLEDAMLAMWQIWRCLKPGGRLFARVSCEGLPMAWLRKGAYHRATAQDELLEMLRGFEGKAEIKETFIPVFSPPFPIRHWVIDAVKKVP
jgi:SAM-dependent methyltransferase